MREVLGLGTPLKNVLGDKTAKALATGLDLHTVDDLLRHYPRRYANRGELTDLAHLPLNEQVTVVAKVDSVRERTFSKNNRKGSLLEVMVTDGRGRLKLTFFNQRWREKDLRVGSHGLFAGKVTEFNRVRQLTHPDYQLLGNRPGFDLKAFADELIPVYPATAAMASWSIAKSLRIVLDGIGDLPDPLPEEVRERHGLLGLREALTLMHRPETMDDVRRAKDRLRYDEAFLLQVVLAQRRLALASLPATPRPTRPGGLLEAFDAGLPFQLTEGQSQVAEVIENELADGHPMHRLLQGEVGSGKTVVALRAMLTVVDSGGQAAMLAPTEVLAQQHHRLITHLLGPLAERGLLGGGDTGTRVALLTGAQATAGRRQALRDVASGEAGIVVGTHALIQDRVDFADLGLVVVDEQHRFGVEQRDALRAKAEHPPHLLVMTATPIPRTVAMTVFGDLEVSYLTELPGGRSPIVTHVVPAGEKPSFVERMWQRVSEEVAAGHQVYVVCPRIGVDASDPEASKAARNNRTDTDELNTPGDDADRGAGDDTEQRPMLAVLDVIAMLRDGPLQDLKVEMLHGRMAPDAKDEVMRRFVAADVDVLVATTVIEVGVDVANATVMVILDAERFGVSQLHQLRGRVGRGVAAGLCLLVSEAEAGSAARQRLEAVAATLDGIELSRVDLQHRREGDVLGASQSGRRSSLRLLSVIRDEQIIEVARQDAAEVVEQSPELIAYPALRSAIDLLLDDERADYLEKT